MPVLIERPGRRQRQCYPTTL